MKAGHSKLDGYSATLPAVRPSPRLPTAATPLPPPSPCEKPHGPISRPEHLLNRLAADPPPLSPASTVPLAVTSTAPAISYLPPACKAGKTLLLDASKLSSMAVPYLLILFPDTDFLFRRYQPLAHPLCGAGALKMSLSPFVGLTSPHSLHPLPPSQGGRGSG